MASVEAEIEDLEVKAKAFFEEKAVSADQLIGRLSHLETQAKNLVQVIGNVGVTGNYQNRAESEATQANLWRWITIVLFGIGVALVIANIILNFVGKIDLQLLLARFAIAVSVALPAIYTAKESARHRSNSDRARQTELELASLGPFLETLPEERRDSIVSDLSNKYFGKSVEEHRVESPINIEKLIDTISKIALSKV